MRHTLSIAAATATATALALVAVPGASSPATAADRAIVLTSGHIDLFEVSYNETAGALALQVKDDTGLHDPGSTFRDPADVTVAVDATDSALVIPEDLPDSYDFLGEPGDTVYTLPFTQDPALPWPGWSTERLTGSLPASTEVVDEPDAVQLTVEVEGPGDVHTWMDGAFGDPVNHYVDTTDDAADVIPVSRNAHVHTAWSFSELGEYTLTVTPTARTTSGSTLSGPAESYHFRVGDVAEELSIAVTPNQPDADYLYGQGITLTAAPSPATDLDHYHWFVRTAGSDAFVISNRSATSELKLPTSLSWDGAQVYAELYDENHDVAAVSEPVTLSVTALDPTTELTATADQPTHQVGDLAQFTSTQSPQTDDDHYHWYLRKPGEEFDTYIPESNQATATLPIAADMDGGEVIARLFDDQHAVLAESEPIVLDVSAAEVAATTTTLRLSRGSQVFAGSGPATATIEVTAGEAPGVGSITLTAGRTTLSRGLRLDEGRTVVSLPSRLFPGRHAMTAHFNPAESTQAASTSASRTLVVRKAVTKVLARPVKPKIAQGKRARLVVKVTAPVVPRGTVTVLDGKRRVVARALKAKQVKITLPRLAPGKHRLTVRVAGDPRLEAAVSKRITVTVRR